MKTVKFQKYSGAGNDFVVIQKDDLLGENLSENEIKSICARRTGVGADGVIIIAKSSNTDFSMLYFNADGSSGMLCGNGARCALKFASETLNISNEEISFECNGEVFSGKIKNEKEVSFKFNSPSNLTMNKVVESIYGEINFSSIDTGSPHIVVDVIDNTQMLGVFSEWEDLPVYNLGKELRYNKEVSDEGTNVNFVRVQNGEILIRTYERGVENETLACATGSVAAVLILAKKNEVETPVQLKTKGGEVLIVEFEKDGDTFSNIWLTGNAKKIYNGIIELEL